MGLVSMWTPLWYDIAIEIAESSYPQGDPMKTVQMTLDDELVEAVDKAAKRLGTSRSAFARKALRQALTRLRAQELERKHRLGYERHPVKPDEFGLWEPEQIWPD